MNRKNKPKRAFFSLGRREFLQLGLFSAAVGLGYWGKKNILDPIPDFAQKGGRGEPKTELPATAGNLVWDGQYDLQFAHKYIDFAKKMQDMTQSDLFADITAHPFPIDKYRLTRENALAQKIAAPEDFSPTAPFSIEDLAGVHSKGYLLKIYLLSYSFLGLANGENPLMPEMPGYVRIAGGGTYTAAQIALEKKIAMNINGGFHHAMADHENGFCFINDTAITIKKLRSENKIKKALVVDLDIHHGDGNARIMANDPKVAIFDVYQENTYPYKKYPVEYSVPIDTKRVSGRVTDDFYLNALKGLPAAVKKEQPDLILYLAGADPHKNDMLGAFHLSKEGLRQRDRFVIETARQHGVPIAITTAGGYPRKINDCVEIHTNTVDLVRQYS